MRQRRNFWPQVAANCPEFDVKQRIMSHEYEELVEDEHSKHGHLDLIFRQGKEVGLSVDDILMRSRCRRPRRRSMPGSGSPAIALGRRRSRHRRLRNGPTTIGCWATSVAAIALGCTRSGKGI